MPDEFHRLMFSNAELKEAVRDNPERTAKKMPSGDVTDVIPAALIIDLCGPNLSIRWT